MLPKSTVKLAVAGAEYSGWYAIDMDSDIFIPADAFRVESMVPDDPDFIDVFREGVSVDVYVDDDRQMAGVIDSVSFTSAPERTTVSIDGRDKGAYLADCEAKHIKASKYTLKTLIESLIQPEWGIRNIILSNEDNRKLLLGKKDKRSKAGTGKAGIFGDLPRAQTKIDPGEHISDVLDRHTRKLGVTWWITAQGDIFIGKPNYNQEPSYEFRAYKPGTDNARTKNNCTVSLERSMGNRYSTITMAGQGLPSKGDIFSSTPGTSSTRKFKATATDPDLVARGVKRTMIVVDNDSLSNDEVQKNVDFDMQQRRMNALRIHVTYPSLRYEENARLFAVDTLAHVIYEEARINDTYYVTQRRNIINAQGESTQLTLMEAGVWLP